MCFMRFINSELLMTVPRARMSSTGWRGRARMSSTGWRGRESASGTSEFAPLTSWKRSGDTPGRRGGRVRWGLPALPSQSPGQKQKQMHSPPPVLMASGVSAFGAKQCGFFSLMQSKGPLPEGTVWGFFYCFRRLPVTYVFLGVAQRLHFRWHCGETWFHAPFNSMETAVAPCHSCLYQERWEQRGAPRQAPHACPLVVCGTTEGPEARVQMLVPTSLPSSLRAQVGGPASYWD